MYMYTTGVLFHTFLSTLHDGHTYTCTYERTYTCTYKSLTTLAHTHRANVYTCMCEPTRKTMGGFPTSARAVLNFLLLPPLCNRSHSNSMQHSNYRLLSLVNPRHACAARVTVVGLCVCVFVCLSVCQSTTILALQATRRLISDTNSFSATRA